MRGVRVLASLWGWGAWGVSGRVRGHGGSVVVVAGLCLIAGSPKGTLSPEGSQKETLSFAGSLKGTLSLAGGVVMVLL